jgi:NADP-dependent 3-hydroxy acid dehydrogenase YdfG
LLLRLDHLSGQEYILDVAPWVEDAVVVVTGAAGGVGQSVAGCLADRGAQVFSLDRRRPEELPSSR